MACGAPVIASRRGALSEVGGDSILLVDDPYDVETWARQIESLLSDNNKVSQMREKARDRSARFDWNECAELTLKEYDKLVKHQ
jgi:glycosyltransferase involved in cell wall biosynthesis